MSQCGLAGIQAPIIMMSQNRAAARDEILGCSPLRRDAQHRRAARDRTPPLTQQVHDLAQRDSTS